MKKEPFTLLVMCECEVQLMASVSLATFRVSVTVSFMSQRTQDNVLPQLLSCHRIHQRKGGQSVSVALVVLLAGLQLNQANNESKKARESATNG